MLDTLIRKSRQLASDSILRRWLAGRLVGRHPGEPAFVRHCPPFLEGLPLPKAQSLNPAIDFAGLPTAAPAGPGGSTIGSIGLATLTTPVAYLSRFREDPFSRTPNASLGYFGHGNDSGWIIFSLGPDRDENSAGGPGDISPTVEKLYDLSSDFPGMWIPSSKLIDARYDPTNGLFSNGDIYRMHGD